MVGLREKLTYLDLDEKCKISCVFCMFPQLFSIALLDVISCIKRQWQSYKAKANAKAEKAKVKSKAHALHLSIIKLI